jgi:hypothetical protein
MALRRLALLLSCLVLLPAGATKAAACACCTNAGQRLTATVKLDSGRRDQIKALRFAAEARLFLGEADLEAVRGITTPAERYTLATAWHDNRLVFTFRDERGRTGTLSLALPVTVSLFEVDPRAAPDQNREPSLYKEWTLTAPFAGSGIFLAGLGPRQRLTLILHGAGNACTSADDFSHWTLLMAGPKGSYSLFGDLVSVRTTR